MLLLAMIPLSTFDLNKEPLLDLLQSIKEGKVQLADFQRDWLWEDDRIRALLASISLGFPVGTLMFLQQDNTQVRLKPRLVEGVELLNPPAPHFLILDGQQRLTSLFMSLFSDKPVIINRGKRYKPELRSYYFDIYQALSLPETERVEAIYGFNDQKKLHRSQKTSIDCSSPENEYKANFFPFSKVFNFRQWRSAYSKYWHYDAEKLQLIEQFEAQIIKKFEHYQMGLYILRPELPKTAVCHIFVSHNELPCELTYFDLLTSEYSGQNFDLRADWAKTEKRLTQHKVLRLLKSTDFLQALSLISTYHHRLEAKEKRINTDILPRITCNRQDILTLDALEYQKWSELLVQGFETVAKFLHTEAIYDADDLPYALQLVTMAPLFVILGESVKVDTVRVKLKQWFYCGASSGIYSRSRESTAAKDLIEIPLWVLHRGETPTTVREAYITEERLQGFVNSQGATYRAISALLRRDGALDFLTGEPITCIKYFAEKIENHHIFPQKWCKKMGIPRSKYNSIVNKTPLRMRTNRFLGSQAPGEYLDHLEEHGLNRERIDEILRSHSIEPDCLVKNDFEGFFRTRTRHLLEMLEIAMGKNLERF